MSLQCPFLNGGFRPAWKVGGGWEERGAEARQVHRRAGWWGGGAPTQYINVCSYFTKYSRQTISQCQGQRRGYYCSPLLKNGD